MTHSVKKTPNQNGSEDIRILERRDAVMKLRRQQLSYRQIAKHLTESNEFGKVSYGCVAKDIAASYDELNGEWNANTERLRYEETDMLLNARAVAINIMNHSYDPDQKIKAIGKVKDLSESIRKMWGTDSPVQVETVETITILPPKPLEPIEDSSVDVSEVRHDS